MSPVGARGIARIARNPHCHLQAAMMILDIPEPEFYELVTDQPYLGSRGERTAALKWGTLFDSRLTEDRAKRLREAIDGWLGIRADSATVRDLRREVPGTQPAALVERNRRVRAILADLLSGLPVPDLLVQPPLRLHWDGQDWGHIVPDALVFDRMHGVYVPLEAKGYISIDGIVGPGERSSLRLQAAVQILALGSEVHRIDPSRAVTSSALLLVATPFGFRPAPAVLEGLGAEVMIVDAALRTMARTARRLEIQLHAMSQTAAIRLLPTHYQEACVTSCAMAEHCRTRAPGMRGELGDRAVTVIGEGIDLARAIALVSGESPEARGEAALLTSLRETAAVFGWGWT